MSLLSPRRCVWASALVIAGAMGLQLVSAQDGKILTERFTQLDKDSDGKLTPQELTAPAIFEKLDSDKDNVVTLDEAKQAFAAGRLTREEVEGRPAIVPKADPISTANARQGSSGLKQQATLLRPADHGVGRYVADIFFTDIKGQKSSFSAHKDSRFVVIAMTSTSCPLSRKYLPSLGQLVGTYSEKGVKFIAVNCVPVDNAKEQFTAAAVLGDRAIYIHDTDEIISRHVGAVTTTDVIVLDQARTVVYHGAIDDQYGIGYATDAPRHSFLASALDALLAGKQPEIAATEAPGCRLEFDEPVGQTEITFHNRVSRILQQHCMECHRSEGVGPFPLETWADVVGHAPMIEQVVQAGTMPPWFAAPVAGQHASLWANDRSLSESDRSDLLTWLRSDRLEGDVADAPLARVFPEAWTMGTPDLIVQIPAPIQVKATGTMPYQFVTAETTLEEDKWVQGYEIVPTDRSVVHHVIVNVHEKGSGRARDREEGLGGYWAAYVPGNAGQVYPAGFARKLPAGATVSFQIHYTPNGTATQDQLKMGLIFAKSEPQYVITTIPLADADLNIPPNEADHVESITRPVPADTHVLAYMAHMHVRGKSFRFEMISPDGVTETLLDIPHYDFNWQLRYDYREPKVIPAGSQVKVTAVFDNSDKNPANPDPSRTVHWGQQTFEEMMIGYVETFAPVGEQRPVARLRGGSGQALFKLLDSDANEKLSREEARRAISRVPRLKDNPEILERLFDQVDSDKDDQLNVDEFEQLRELLGARR